MVKNDWSGQPLPHPPGRRPWVGDLLGMDKRAPLQGLMRRSAGPLFAVRIFQQQLVFVTTASLSAELCDEARFEKALSPALRGLRGVVGDGLFTAFNDEPSWQVAHDLLLPAFSRSAMETYHPVMLQAVGELFDRWDALDGPVDVSADMTKLTMETIGRAAFSHDFGSFTRADTHPFVPAMVAALRGGQRVGALSAMPGAAVLRRSVDRRNSGHQAYVDEMLDGLIAARRREGPGERDLLDRMLTSGRLSDANIRHQVLTFLVAGHETTSGALSFALYYLSRHPEALAAAQAETDALLGPARDAEPAFGDVPRFRYLRRVLDESLRLWPTAPGFARSPREETVLGGYRMRPQDWALTVLPLVHRDPEVWGEDADRFDPDRFLPARGRERPPHSYKPFGTGERACIGRQFALHEAILVLARLLHRYDLQGDPAYDLRISERLTLMPVGFELRLSPRTPAVVAAQPAAVAAHEGCPVSGH